MKGTIEGKELLRAVELAKSVVVQHQTLPVLAGIHLELVEPNHCRLRATNLEQHMTVEIEAVVEESGTTVVGASRFSAIVKECSGGPLVLTQNDGPLIIEGDGARFELFTLTPADFPEAPKVTPTVTVVLQAVDMAQALAQAEMAASRDEGRYAIAGIRLEVRGTALIVTATDGHRLLETQVALADRQDATPVWMVPIGGIKSLLSVLKRAGKESVTLMADEKEIVVTMPGLEYGARVSEGQYPNVEGVKQACRAYSQKVPISRGPLRQALRRAMLVGDLRTPAVRLEFKEQELRVVGVGTEIGTAELRLPVPWTGQPALVGVNARYLLEYLDVIEAETVDLGLGPEPATQPIWVGGPGLPEYIVMPLKC